MTPAADDKQEQAKPVENGDAAAPMETEEPAAPEQSDAQKVAAQLAGNVALIEKSVKQKETRMGSGRLLRTTAAIRRKLSRAVLQQFISSSLPEDSAMRPVLLSALEQLPDAMASDTADRVASEPDAATASPVASGLPEVEAYASLLVLMVLTDGKHWAEAKDVATAAVQRLGSFNRRTLDVLAARVYHYYSLAHERTGTLPTIRSQLLALHRTATLRHDSLGQETLLNLLLRNHLAFNLYDQAEALRSKAQRPEVSRSATQAARYLYYHGRILAVQLDYTAARDTLQQAARKAPIAAYAFRAEITKWLALVRLLLSDIPDRAELAAPGLATALQPYFHLTNAVRTGSLATFQEVAERYKDVWRRDRVANLVVRLRQNVLRAGLARMGAAYSRISLADVASKLGVGSAAADAESIVAKVVRDGGLEATVDHEAGVMVCREAGDVYATAEPAAAFHQRTAFCLDIHNEAVRAMRFEDGAHRRKGESDEARAERIPADAELSAALAEDDDDLMGF